MPLALHLSAIAQHRAAGIFGTLSCPTPKSPTRTAFTALSKSSTLQRPTAMSDITSPEDIPTLVSLYEDGKLPSPHEPSSYSYNDSINARVSIWRGKYPSRPCPRCKRVELTRSREHRSAQGVSVCSRHGLALQYFRHPRRWRDLWTGI
jgi:hypothetical protein